MTTYYKYRGDSAFTERIISSGKIFLATAAQLNDPFECMISAISEDWLNENTRTCMEAALAGFTMAAMQAVKARSSLFGLKRSAAEKALKSVLQSPHLEEKYEAMRSFVQARTTHFPSDCRVIARVIDDQLSNVGIFSMSREPVQDLMWAHYAGDHKGICLGFMVDRNCKLANPAHCLPVTYSNSAPEMAANGLKMAMTFAVDDRGRPYTLSHKLSFDDQTLQRVISTKPVAWAYEQEVRYVEPYSGECEWPGPLTDVTFGFRCPEDRRNYYVSLLEDHVKWPVLLYEIRRNVDTYSLERAPLEQPKTSPRKRPEILGTSDSATQMPPRGV